LEQFGFENTKRRNRLLSGSRWPWAWSLAFSGQITNSSVFRRSLLAKTDAPAKGVLAAALALCCLGHAAAVRWAGSAFAEPAVLWCPDLPYSGRLDLAAPVLVRAWC